MVATLVSGANNAALAYTPEHRRGSLTRNGVTTYYFSNPDAGVTGELVAGFSPVWRTYAAKEVLFPGGERGAKTGLKIGAGAGEGVA